MVIDVMDTQPRLSVTVKVYDPAGRVKVPVPVYGAVPPIADTVTVVLPPKHAMVPAEDDASRTDGWLTVVATIAEHPAASVTV